MKNLIVIITIVLVAFLIQHEYLQIEGGSTKTSINNETLLELPVQTITPWKGMIWTLQKHLIVPSSYIEVTLYVKISKCATLNTALSTLTNAFKPKIPTGITMDITALETISSRTPPVVRLLTDNTVFPSTTISEKTWTNEQELVNAIEQGCEAIHQDVAEINKAIVMINAGNYASRHKEVFTSLREISRDINEQRESFSKWVHDLAKVNQYEAVTRTLTSLPSNNYPQCPKNVLSADVIKALTALTRIQRISVTSNTPQQYFQISVSVPCVADNEIFSQYNLLAQPFREKGHQQKFSDDSTVAIVVNHANQAISHKRFKCIDTPIWMIEICSPDEFIGQRNNPSCIYGTFPSNLDVHECKFKPYPRNYQISTYQDNTYILYLADNFEATLSCTNKKLSLKEGTYMATIDVGCNLTFSSGENRITHRIDRTFAKYVPRIFPGWDSYYVTEQPSSPGHEEKKDNPWDEYLNDWPIYASLTGIAAGFILVITCIIKCTGACGKCTLTTIQNRNQNKQEKKYQAKRKSEIGTRILRGEGYLATPRITYPTE